MKLGGKNASRTITIDRQVAEFEALSLTVKVTTLLPAPTSVPAAGVCMIDTDPQASVAAICDRRSGTTTCWPTITS